MVESKIIEELRNVLNQFQDRYIQKGGLKKNIFINDLKNYREDLIVALLENDLLRRTYIKKIRDVNVFQIDLLIEMLQYRDYWSDSYTKYKNKIGLSKNGDFLIDNEDVYLDFPYKDAVLKAGMTKDDQKMNEVFLNEVVAKSEIDTLFEGKIIKNVKEYAKELTDTPRFSINKNYIIKANNLIALHTLKTVYQQKFDVIYIDPPYNVRNSNNTFLYNNKFNHSSWLAFMKNRLEVAKKLLSIDGSMIIAIDENELCYLGVLLDELFESSDKHIISIIHNPRGVQGTNFSYNNEFAVFIIPKNKKVINDRILNEDEIEWSPLRNWGGESLRTDAKNCFYPIITKNNQIVGFGPVSEDNYHPNKNEIEDGYTYVYPIDQSGIERKWRYARQTVEGIKDLLKVKENSNGILDIMLGKNFGQYKTVWQDKRYDASVHGKQLLKKYVPDTKFTFPKSVYTVYDCLYAIVGNKKDALILDFFGGSGTTAHAVELLNREDNGNRNYVLVEQMDYVQDTIVERMKNVGIEDGKNTYFTYFELMEKNMGFIKDVLAANNIDDLKAIFSRMIEIADLDFRVDLEKIDWTISLSDQKNLLVAILDKNQLYFNYSEIDDADVRELISDEDYAFNKSFYEGE